MLDTTRIPVLIVTIALLAPVLGVGAVPGEWNDANLRTAKMNDSYAGNGTLRGGTLSDGPSNTSEPDPRGTGADLASAPPGLGAEDPWVDANGDEMFGNLDMGVNAIFFRDTGLVSPAEGVLQFGGSTVCFESGPCGSDGTVTLVDTGDGLTGGPIATTGTVSIEAGGVTSAMLEDGTIQLVDLGFDTATQDELDAYAAHLASSGTLNDPSNPVHWTRLLEIPAGLADGVDNDTTYDAGQGLSLTGTTFALVACTDGEVLKHNGTAWACGPDDDTDTTYAAGTGLALDDTTFNVDTSIIQARVGEACAEGSYVRAVNQDGTVVCETDDGTSYTGETPIDVSGTTIALSTTGCAAGDVWKWNGTAWTCVEDDDTDTTYSAGDGLNLDATTFNLVACTAGQVLKHDGASWACGADEDTDTTYDAGTGLDLSGTTFSADTSVLQARVSDACAEGSYMRAVNQDGTVVCETDDGTSYTGETPIDVSGTTIALSTTGCAAGDVWKWNGTAWTCVEDDDTDTTYSAGDGLSLAGTTFAIQECGDGEVLKNIDTMWSCAADDDTTYSAGDGLSLAGTTFSIQECGDGEVLKNIDTMWFCAADDDTTYDGTDFALSDQSCATGEVVSGVDAAGSVTCAPDRDTDTTYSAGDGLRLVGTTFSIQECGHGEVLKNIDTMWFCAADDDTTYDGTDFALSDQSCATGEVVSGVDAAGSVTCAPDQDTDTTYDGTDFALSDQSCATGEVVSGVDAAGSVTCATDQDTDTTYSAGNGLSLDTSTNTFSADTSVVQARVSDTCGANGAIAEVNTDGTVVCRAVWTMFGNEATIPGPMFLGTTDDNRLDLRVDSTMALRLEPTAGTPNVVGGNASNSVTTDVAGATIAGGGGTTGNTVTDNYGVVGGGLGNQAGDGAGTTTSAIYATVGGGRDSTASAHYATVGGGLSNTAEHWRATVSGGSDNAASNVGATVGGGRNNDASGLTATVAGGYTNEASGSYAAVGGGYQNVATGHRAVVAGGDSNTASGDYGAVAGGILNHATGDRAVVSGGSNNNATGTHAAVAGGEYNNATGNHSFVAGGLGNDAYGNYSFAGGYRAFANDPGAFVWAGGLDLVLGGLSSNGTSSFNVYAPGGTEFISGRFFCSGAFGMLDVCETGVKLEPGESSWSSLSDRASKENVEPVDGADILDRLMGIEISEWNYIAQDPSTRHLGPMAQDFHAAFGLGSDHTRINTIDADGVALAAIQGLNEKLEQQADLIEEQQETIEEQARMLEGLAERLSALEEGQEEEKEEGGGAS